MAGCRICGSDLSSFLDFGKMPLGDGFLAPEAVRDEYFFHLEAALCEHCGMVQLVHDVPRERMFHEDYAFFSSTSRRMVEHFREFGRSILRTLEKPEPFVIEVGCNDGVLLEELAKGGARHLGVDPAANVAKAARDRGLRVECTFFDEESARRIAALEGPADAIVAANCMCHLPYMDSVLRGVDLVLAPDGLFVFEDPYLGDIVKGGAFDQFYDEHMFYFSVSSVAHMVERHGFELVDIEPQAVHGGSMRYTVARRGARKPEPRVAEAMAHEASAGLLRRETFDAFRARAEHVRQKLPALLRELRAQGKTIAGYAATAKSATVLNYCGITTDLVPCIYDTTPSKHGRLSPGVHIPVRPYEEFTRNPPDYALLLAWNHAAEIREKERAFIAAGGRFVVYVPDVKIVD